MLQTARTIQIHLLGRPHLASDDVPIKFKAPPRALSLLAFLLVNDGAPLMRDAVAFALWPDDMEADARANLRRHLFYLTNDVLPPAAAKLPWILADKRTIGWNAETSAWCDVRDFSRLAAASSAADAVALYRGDLLEGFEDEWLQAPRERLRERQIALLLELIETSRTTGDQTGAIAYARRLLEIDPWREDAIRALIALRNAAGDRAGALATYRDFVKRLDAEIGVAPMPETTAAYQLVATASEAPPTQAKPPASEPASAGEFAVEREPFAPPEAIANAEAVRSVSSFTGRERELERIETALWDGNGIAAIHGLGGVGKSALAREYARLRRSRYAAVWSLHAENEDGIIDGLVRLGAAFDPAIAKRGDRRAAAEHVIVNVLRNLAKPALLIFDNLDDERLLHRWQPASCAHVVVTARRAVSGGSIVSIRLDGWEGGESVRYLQREIGRPDIESSDAQRLAQTLGSLPLALAHAAAYLKSTVNVTVDRYLERLDEHFEKAPRGADYDGAVFATFRESVMRAECEAPGAAALLGFAATFAPDAIPDELFVQDVAAYAPIAPALPATPPPRDLRATVERAGDRDDALGALDRFALLTFSPQTRTYAMHRLVQAAARTTIVTDRWAWAQSAVRAAEAAFPMHSDFTQWARCARLAAHGRAALDALDGEAGDRDICYSAARLALRCGHYLRKRAAFSAAESLLRRGLLLAQTCSADADDLTVAEHGVALAVLLRDTNRPAEAAPLQRRSIAIYEVKLGAGHPRLAAALNDLAILLQYASRQSEAEALFRRALDIDQAAFGEDHPTVALRRHNLALVLHETGRFDEAESLLRRALAVDERTFGRNHPDVAGDVGNLGWLLFESGRMNEAEPLLREAVRIRAAVYGTDHPSYAHALNDLGVFAHDTHATSEAAEMYRTALAIYEESYGLHHPVVAACLNDIAKTAADDGRPAEAEALYRRALQSDEATYGQTHMSVARDLSNLAGLLAVGACAEAADLMRRAVAIAAVAGGGDRRAQIVAHNAAQLATPAAWQHIRRAPSRGFR